MESKFSSKVLDFWRGKGLGEHISDHVVDGAVDKAQFAIVNNPVDKMEAYVNVLGAGMILMILQECDHRLIVGEECGGSVEWKGSKHLTNQQVQPQHFFCHVCHSDVLAFCH